MKPDQKIEALAKGADCHNCPMTKRPYVPSTSNTNAKIAIVGEAPGAEEVQKGEPFVGMSGIIINELLVRNRLKRDDVLFTNTVLCRPRGNTDPKPEAVAACAPRLKAELATAEKIVACGTFASKALVPDSQGVTKDRVGPPRKLSTGQEVIPTFHPAAAMRNEGYFRDIVTDFSKLVLDRKVWEPPEYTVLWTAEEAAQVLEALPEQEFMVIDIETGVDKDADYVHPTRIRCIGITTQDRKHYVIAEGALHNGGKVKKALSEICKRALCVYHNGKFDVLVLQRLGYDVGPIGSDTMIRSYVLDERTRTHSLAYLGRELLGTPNWKGVIESNGGYNDCPEDILYEYNAYDIAITYDLYLQQENIMSDKDKELERFLVDAANMLIDVEDDGMAISEKGLAKAKKEVSTNVDKLQEFFGELNPNSPKQLVEYFEKEFDAKLGSTNVDALEKIISKTEKKAPEIAEFCHKVLEYRKQRKLLGTYIEGMEKRLEHGRLHTSFLIHGTVTGRLSSRNPNLQNIPRGSSIKGIFVPDEGNVFVQADYKAAELRTVAVLSKAQSLKDMFDQDRDLHGEVAAEFFGPDFTKDQRVKAKTVVFGIMYGRTKFGLARDRSLGVTKDEADKFIEAFHKLVPEVKPWQESVEQIVRSEDQFLTTPFGRQRRFQLLTKFTVKEMIKEALAFLPQSIASDICLGAGIDLHREGLRIKLLVHDSIMVECKPDEVKDVSKLMTDVMVNSAAKRFSDWVPFDVDVESGHDWGSLE